MGEGEKIFTPEQLNRMAKDAAANKKAEDIRSGDYVPPLPVPGPEAYIEVDESADKTALPQTNKVKSKLKLFIKTKKEGPKDWYRRSEEKLEKLNDLGPRLKA